jgi:CubicO group peptidase (beta-lactamase class C family)
MHLLADWGVIDYDDRIVKYWPEFGQHGKHNVTIRDALTHRSGVPQMPADCSPALLADWDAACAVIAAAEPLWEPGTKTGYHALTFGWINGEVARRADGRPVAQIVQEEICGPLRLNGIFFGIRESEVGRVAPLEDGPPPATPAPPLSADSLLLRAIPAGVGIRAEVWNRPEVRRASIPAGGGLLSARSLARMYAALITEVEGRRLFSQDRMEAASALQVSDTDAVMGMPVVRSLGFGLGAPLSPQSERISAFGHAGAGGSIGFADPAYGFAFALTKNRIIMGEPPGHSTANKVARVTRAALNIPEGPDRSTANPRQRAELVG